MTGVAVVMRREVRGNREAGASIHRRVVTTSTTILRTRGAAVVLRVIEVDVKDFVEARGETFQRRIVALRVGVTDQAHRNRRRRELAAMAVGARFVAGEARRGGVVGAFVTRVAGDGAMLRARVKELRVIRVRSLGINGRTQKTQTKHSKSSHLMSFRLSGGRCAI